MLKKTAKHMNMLVSELKRGIHTPVQLADSLHISKRQVYRLLENGLDSGLIQKVAPGIYVHKSVNSPSFESYLSVEMSQNKQHNITQQNIINELDSTFTLNNNLNTSKSVLSSVNAADKIHVIVEWVCDKAQLNASELELKRAERIVRQSVVRQAEIDYLISNEILLEEYTMESVRRMMERLEMDPEAVHVNLVTYFFGIFRNVVRSDARAWYRHWKAMMKDGVGFEVAVGTEEASVVAVSPSIQNEDSIEWDNSISNDDKSLNSSQDNNVSEEWKSVAISLEELVKTYSLRWSSAHVASVRQIVLGLDVEGIAPENVQSALDDVVEHDLPATEYLVRLIKSGLVEETIVQLEKHFARSKTRNVNLSMNKNSEKTASVFDERYENFYKLFPDQ